MKKTEALEIYNRLTPSAKAVLEIFRENPKMDYKPADARGMKGALKGEIVIPGKAAGTFKLTNLGKDLVKKVPQNQMVPPAPPAPPAP